MQLNEELEKYRIGLSVNLYTAAEFTSWADAAVLNLEEPPAVLLDLSLSSSNIKKVLFILNEYIGVLGYNFVIDREVVKNNLLGSLYEKFLSAEINLEQTVKMLYRLSQYSLFEKEQELSTLDDAYELARQGIWGTMDEVKQRFIALMNSIM